MGNSGYISKELRDEAIKRVQEKGQPVMVLEGQNHSPWKYDICNEVYNEELKFLDKYFT